MTIKPILGVLAAAAIMGAMGDWAAGADVLTWTAGAGDWFNAANWTNWGDPENTRVPAAGDAAVVSNAGASVVLTGSTPWLASVFVSNATVTFSNWNTTLQATNVTVERSGQLTCFGPFTNNGATNRVSLICSNLTIESGGAINVTGKGWAGGTNTTATYTPGNGPGGASYLLGACYGGAGSAYNGLTTSRVYGSATAPTDPGSGGNANHLKPPSTPSLPGGDGGGAVCITAEHVAVKGVIYANANPAQFTSFGHRGGGTGGSIFITCRTITGTGQIWANGGAGYYAFLSDQGGAGGGGRIAVIYDPAAQAALEVPQILFRVSGALAYGAYDGCSDIGTLYFPDSRFFSLTNGHTGQWLAPGLSNITADDIVVNSSWLRVTNTDFTLTAANSLTLSGTNARLHRLELPGAASVQCGSVVLKGGSLVLGSGGHGAMHHGVSYEVSGGAPNFTCAGGLTLTNGGRLYVTAGLTNPASAGFGAKVNVQGDIQVYENSWIFPGAHPTSGAPVLLAMQNLNILHTNAGINADARGFSGGIPLGSTAGNAAYGPGAAAFNGGSGYGGAGAMSSNSTPGGGTYGSSNYPVEPGSGARFGNQYFGWRGFLGNGGGSVQVRARDAVNLAGVISASGNEGPLANSGGPSGGAIYIQCRTFVGNSNTVLRARGGDCCYYPYSTPGMGGNGGGGRIAVWRVFDRSPSEAIADVAGGTKYNDIPGGTGTVVWGWIPGAGSIFSFH